ncbi:hypothetical protein [Polaromonas sp. UBA4122]|nr:hypothetical protein [Polaromonas sp. UBA4122]
MHATTSNPNPSAAAVMLPGASTAKALDAHPLNASHPVHRS